MLLAGIPYCPDDWCSLPLLVVASGQEVRSDAPSEWGRMPRSRDAVPHQRPRVRSSARAWRCGRPDCRATIAPGHPYVTIPDGRKSTDLCIACALATAREDVRRALDGVDLT